MKHNIEGFLIFLENNLEEEEKKQKYSDKLKKMASENYDWWYEKGRNKYKTFEDYLERMIDIGHRTMQVPNFKILKKYFLLYKNEIDQAEEQKKKTIWQLKTFS